MQALWMVLAAFLFATMAVGVKMAGADFNAFELVFYRGVISVVFMAMVLRSRGVSIATKYPFMHAWRSMIGVFSMVCWFYAIAHLPLATAMTLNYMSGVWMAAFVIGGAVLYGKPGNQGMLMATVLVSFTGVILLLQPSLAENQLFAGLIGLLSGLGAAMALLQVASLGRIGEPEGRVVFYFSIGTLLVGLAGSLWTGFTPWSSVRWQALAWLLPIGVLATLGQWTMTRAYSRGSTLLVANLAYLGIVFSGGYGLLLFGEQITAVGWAGIAMILVSGVTATVLRTRALPNAPADEH
ncbi:DMT family transporter [Rhodoferax fermentans]|uniref:EamA family transporter n=1 Tax=Rhodoferax fermentans TaxID=28066 RepID=A0A1T1AQ09_RHOFE|nr:DMT family transporter [Rhodoferax fermentans]MBK1682443.1 EamA/RhaT family transporter [Rhodoferax fermentans]OOV06191.1 EamA family transporter [Rhodoferax fermentans]